MSAPTIPVGGRHQDAVRDLVARIKAKKPLQETVPVVLDDACARRRDDAEMALERAEAELKAAPGPVTQLAVDTARAELDEALAALDEATVGITVRCIGRHAYDELVSDHPPTEEQIAQAEAAGHVRPDTNADTFPIALLAAAITDPPMTIEDVAEIWTSEAWNAAELKALYQAAVAVNVYRRTATLGKGYGATRGS